MVNVAFFNISTYRISMHNGNAAHDSEKGFEYLDIFTHNMMNFAITTYLLHLCNNDPPRPGDAIYSRVVANLSK